MTFRPRLWPVIEASAGDPEKLRAQLADASADQLVYLFKRYLRATAELRDVPAFWEHAAPGKADRLARWVVNQGHDAWATAQQDPSQLPREPVAGYPDYSVVIGNIYRDRFGTGIPLAEPDPSKDPTIVYSPEWEDRLWRLIDELNHGVSLESALDGYTRSDFARLALAFDHARSRLQRRFEPKYGDDPNFDWPMWCHWVISQGKQRYDEYLEHPETVQPSDHDDFTDWLFELMDEYERRYETRLPQRKSLYGRRQDVLRLLRDERGKATQARLAKALPANFDIPELLEDLRTRGWAEPTSKDDADARWAITSTGQQQLADEGPR